jgi:ABC-type bacteriocin/lantibiotic exporter with double-glycine peptidase domain
MEALECGAACLSMVLAYYKRFIPLEQLRLDCNVSRDGSSAKYIVLAARFHGMAAQGYRRSPEQLKEMRNFLLSFTGTLIILLY